MDKWKIVPDRGFTVGFEGTGSTPPPPFPPIFGRVGYLLGRAIGQNAFSYPAGGFFGCLAIAAAYDSGATLCEQIRATLGADSYAIIPGDGVLQPNAVRFTVNGRNSLYAVAGTTNLLQWLRYIFPTAEVQCTGVAGKVYRLFSELASAGYARILTDALQRPKSETIALVGHSLGGAMAELWGNKLVNLDGFRFACVTTFGAPRFGTLDYANTSVFPMDFNRVVSEGDKVPNVLPSVYGGSALDGGGFTGTAIARYSHKCRRPTIWRDDGWGNHYQEDGTVSQALKDLGSLIAGIGELPTLHSLRTYGRQAWQNSTLARSKLVDPGVLANYASLAHSLFGA